MTLIRKNDLVKHDSYGSGIVTATGIESEEGDVTVTFVADLSNGSSFTHVKTVHSDTLTRAIQFDIGDKVRHERDGEAVVVDTFYSTHFNEAAYLIQLYDELYEESERPVFFVMQTEIDSALE